MTHTLSLRVLAGRRLATLPVLAFLLLVGFAAGVSQSPPVQAAPLSLEQCNGHGASAEGASTLMRCTVVVVNTLNGASQGSTTTLTRECLLGPCSAPNGTFVSTSTELVTSVNQCNDSDNDAAHPITCDVTITNNISIGTSGAEPLTAATVNQCVGSATGGGAVRDCDPFPATTTGATVTQCNGSGNGGGGTVRCTVDPASLVSPAIPISVNQCNGTGNPGGSVVTCSTRILTNLVAATTTTTSATSTSATSTSATSTSATSTSATSTGTGGTGGGGTGTGGTGGTGGGGTGGGGGGGTAGTGGGGGGGTGAAATESQIVQVPAGGVQAGGGSTSQVQDSWLIALGTALVLASGGFVLLRRRPKHRH